MEDKNPLEQIEQPFDRKIAGNFQLRTRVVQNRFPLIKSFLRTFRRSQIRGYDHDTVQRRNRRRIIAIDERTRSKIIEISSYVEAAIWRSWCQIGIRRALHSVEDLRTVFPGLSCN